MRGGAIKIMEVNSSTLPEFNRLIKIKDQPAIVKFYADWCGHCQDLNPKWRQMISQLDKKNLKGILASVSEKYRNDIDCDSDVMGYPTIRVFKGGVKKRDYRGKREVKDLEKFVKKMLGKCRRTKKRKTKRCKRKGRKGRKGKKTRKTRHRGRDGLRERFFKMISTKRL